MDGIRMYYLRETDWGELIQLAWDRAVAGSCKCGDNLRVLVP
jgi:hypothetical protein